MTKDEINQSLEKLGKDRHWLAAESSYEYLTVNNKLGPAGKPSKRMMEAFQRVIEAEEARGRVDLTKENLSVWDLVTFTGMETARIMEASKIGGYSNIEDLYHDAIIEYCDELIAEENKVTPLPKANLAAAAGSGIEAELIDLNENAREINVQLWGLSADPMFADGEIVKMAPRTIAKKSQHMAKGKFYLVRYDGELLFKRYNTRPARPDEVEAPYLTASGSVGVLESINPSFDPIDITSPDTHWIAWLEKDGSFPKDI